MLYDDTETPKYYVWRLMIAAEHQQKGYGSRAMELLLDYIRKRPGAEVVTVGSIPGDGSPQAFYERLGFVDTGEVSGGENILALRL